MKRFFAIFVLTPAEQRLVIFVVLLLVAGAWYKHHRDVKLSAVSRPAQAAPASPSPPPNER
jgi:hypothetical protein